MSAGKKSSRIEAAEQRIGAALIRIQQAGSANLEELTAAKEAVADSAQLIERVAQLEADNTHLTTEHAQLKASMAQEKALISDDDGAVATLKAEISSLKIELNNKSQQIAALTTELAQRKERRLKALTEVDVIIERVEAIAEQVNG